MWQWLQHSNPVHRNLRLLQEIQGEISRLNKRVTGALLDSCADAPAVGASSSRRPNTTTAGGMLGLIPAVGGRERYGSLLGSYSKAFSRYSEPPLSPCAKWRLRNYSESLSVGVLVCFCGGGFVCVPVSVFMPSCVCLCLYVCAILFVCLFVYVFV